MSKAKKKGECLRNADNWIWKIRLCRKSTKMENGAKKWAVDRSQESSFPESSRLEIWKMFVRSNNKCFFSRINVTGLNKVKQIFSMQFIFRSYKANVH